MTRKEKAARKALDERLGRISARAVSDRPILLLDIPKVYEAALAAHAEGKDDEGILAAVVAFVETIRVDIKRTA
jgi:hypothetical protein